MSVHCIVNIHDGPARKPLATIYRHRDGEPSGTGAELARFLNGCRITPGFGAARLAALLTARLKRDVSFLPAGSSHRGESFTYRIRVSPGLPASLEAYEAGPPEIPLVRDPCSDRPDWFNPGKLKR
jgi:hypothetical protein